MAVKNIQDLRCPYCGSTEFVKGRRADGAYYRPFIVPLKRNRKPFSLRSYSQISICVFCKKCGSLVREYIRKPELLEKQ